MDEYYPEWTGQLQPRSRRPVQPPPTPDDDDWPEPADLLGQRLAAAASFPVEFLPAAVGEFASDVAHRMQCPVDFVGIPLIIQAGVLIGKEIPMAPKAVDDWIERACLWGAIVCESATQKSPAFKTALTPIQWLQRGFHKQHEQEIEAYKAKVAQAQYAEKSWQEACKSAQKAGQKDMPERPANADSPDAPKLRRLLTADATQEALCDLMEQNPRGLMLFRDELSGWFSAFNQYRPGGDRQFYLECHSGGEYYKDRRCGSALIKDLFLGICGGVQPDILTKVLAGGDRDGMTARFGLMVWPDRSATFRLVDLRANEKARNKTEFVMKELLGLDAERFFGSPVPGVVRALRFDDEAQKIFNAWYTANQVRIRQLEDSAFRTHISKYGGLFARLATVHHLIRYVLKDGAKFQHVDSKTAVAVRDFIDRYLEPHALRIYRHLGVDQARKGAQRIARWIVDDPKVQEDEEFAARDVRRKEWSGLTTQDAVNAALDYLENVAGWVRCIEELPGPRGGRAGTRYRVNPKTRKG